MVRWLVALALLPACQVRDPPPVTGRWQDTFERGEIGRNYRRTGPGYTVAGGRLTAAAAHGRPLWLRKRLPHDVRVEFDAGTSDPTGELRVELFGDGEGDPDAPPRPPSGYAYTWTGSEARLERPGALPTTAVAPRGAATHWTLERSGRTVKWFLGDPQHPRDVQHPVLTFVDPRPLEDDTHAYFGFVGGTDATWFDNLVITPL